MNKFVIGFVTGVILPLIILLFFFLVKYEINDFVYYFKLFFNSGSLMQLISLLTIANAVLFFIYLKFNLDKSAKGVLGSLFFYVIIVIAIKFSAVIFQ